MSNDLRHGLERLGAAARILVQAQNGIVNGGIVGLLGQTDRRTALFFDGSLGIRKHLEHCIVQLRFIVEFAERLPTSPAHRGVGIRLGKLDQSRASGVGQLRALIAERNFRSQFGGARLEHRQPVFVLKRGEIGCRFFGVKGPDVERRLRFGRSRPAEPKECQ